MKYIRTKDLIGTGIFEVQEEHFIKEQNKEQMLVEVITKETMTNPVMRFIPKQIKKSADTIEELCDEFVGIDREGHYLIHKDEWLDGARIIPLEEVNYYGAIWTDKGLIFVARMNNEGVLELL